jgi:hypothetical protein
MYFIGISPVIEGARAAGMATPFDATADGRTAAGHFDTRG